MLRGELGQPLAFIGREHTVRRFAVGQDFVFFENDLVLVTFDNDPMGRGKARDLLVAADGLRLVVVIEAQVSDFVFRQKFSKDPFGFAIKNPKIGSVAIELDLQCLERVPNKTDPGILGVMQVLKDFRIKDEDRLHRLTTFEGGGKSSVVI